jgi:DNA-binding NarL/FixJ family response regulator
VVGQSALHDFSLTEFVQSGATTLIAELMIAIGDSVRWVRELGETNVRPKIVILAASGPPEDALRILEAGASAYRLRELSVRQLWETIDAVSRGGCVIEPQIAARLWERVGFDISKGQDFPAPGLTPRETEVLQSVGLGRTNRETAIRLGIACSTVRTHLEHIYAKLEAANRVEAVLRAWALGPTSPSPGQERAGGVSTHAARPGGPGRGLEGRADLQQGPPAAGID